MSNWRKYNGFLLPKKPPHLKQSCSKLSIFIEVLKKSAYFARWYEGFDASEDGNFYFVIKDTFLSLENLPSKNRREITRGLELCYVQQIESKEYIELMYQVYKNAINGYLKFHEGLSYSDYCSYIHSQSDLGEVDLFGVFDRASKNLIGYSINIIQDVQVEYSNVKLDPTYIKNYSSYALFYKMNEHYLSDNSFTYVNDGAKSILHESDIQEYLIRKHGFRKSFCELKVIYHPMTWVIVKLLYPFRSYFQRANNYTMKKILSLLIQEEILRLSADRKSKPL